MAETSATNPNVCALCGLPVKLDSFTLSTDKGREKFCCAGCLSIYQLINDPEESGISPKTSQENKQP